MGVHNNNEASREREIFPTRLWSPSRVRQSRFGDEGDQPCRSETGQKLFDGDLLVSPLPTSLFRERTEFYKVTIHYLLVVSLV